METYIIIIEQHDIPSGRLYGAFVPDVPGCTATGKSLDETLEQIRTALCAFFRTLQSAGREVPTAHSLEEHQAFYSVSGEPLLGEYSIVAVMDIPAPHRQQFSLAA
jgi:predicted RNase H-like HicB family nuclease